MMLDGGSDHVIAGRNQSENGEVVGFRPPAGKHNFRSPASQQRSHRLTRAFHRGSRLLPMVMDGRRVAEVLAEIWAHGLKNLGQHRRSRVIVEVNSAHGGLIDIVRDETAGWAERGATVGGRV